MSNKGTRGNFTFKKNFKGTNIECAMIIENIFRNQLAPFLFINYAVIKTKIFLK